MPTFTTIALENLLEYRNPTKNSSTIKNRLQPSIKYLRNHEEAADDEAIEENKSKATSRLNHIYISPALYTTPEPTPILDYTSSGSLSPSPYVFNRKGRGAGKSVNPRIDGFEAEESENKLGGNGDVGLQGGEEELVDDSLFGEVVGIKNRLVIEGESEDEADKDFVDPRCDSYSVASSSELNDFGRLGLDNMSVVSNQIGEFYDAIEEFGCDGSMSVVASCSGNIEIESDATRLSVVEEMEKRKIAEDGLAMMCSLWRRVGKLLVGEASSDDMGFNMEMMQQLSQEVIVGRFVAEAMGKAQAQVEAEEAAQVIIISKDKEISRLRDRLQYYEAMIHEMSQNNLESMEVTRRDRERKKGQRKWLWSCIGLSIAVGASVIAYSYAPLSDTTHPEAYD